VDGSSLNCICVGTMSADVPFLPMGSIGPLGAEGEGELKTQKWGWSHSCCGQIPFLFFSALPNVVQYVGHRPAQCAHSGVEPSWSAKAFLQGGPKNFDFFTISRLYVLVSQKLLKIETYKQVQKKRLISPLSNCRMYMDPSLTGFCRMSQKVSDVIPVLRLTPIVTQPSAVSVFLSVAKCGRVCRVQTCAHSGIEPSTLAKGFPHGGPKVRFF